MKMKGKTLIIVICLVLIVMAASMGTIAYFMDAESALNTFTVGSVKITMDEKDVDDSTKDADRDTANKYHLIPGSEYEKDPTIHVDAQSSKCWLFVKVVNPFAAIEGENTIAEQMAEKGWTELKGEGVFAYKEAVDAGADVVVFEKLTISGETENGTLAKLEDESITVTAYAVQEAGFGTAAEAWTTAKAQIEK